MERALSFNGRPVVLVEGSMYVHSPMGTIAWIEYQDGARTFAPLDLVMIEVA